MVTDRYQHVRHHATVEDLAATWAAEPTCRCSASTTCPARPAGGRDAAAACVLLFGQEGPGLSRRHARGLRGDVVIAQFGSTRSINAGAAAAIAMHTWVRQHAAPSA